ncbi:MAG: dTDP-4-dehydrorhamnose 3,5-epimerase [Elusimicrobia bacterium]|nr:dTDP-4-dehydrorhamnose 3,5-epimerase [Elusimicrobiota bacterium]
MIFKALPLQGAFLIRPEKKGDTRGRFFRIFCMKEFARIGQKKPFAQINHSQTAKSGTVRGLHFQYPPDAETRLVKCIRGKVYDVVVDIRRGSPTFLKWHGEFLSAANSCMLYLPEGFAHGFQTMEPNTELIYFHTGFYAPKNEGGIGCQDPILGVKWPRPITHLSRRDQSHRTLSADFRGIKI